MIGIDTNVLARYLIEDDEKQTQKAVELIDKYSGDNAAIFINNIVICELVWVLKRGYNYPKPQLVKLLKEIITTIEFCVEDSKVLWESISEYENSSVDFSDILIGNFNVARGCIHSFTFDKKASNLESFSPIE